MPLARLSKFVVCPLMCQIQAFRYLGPKLWAARVRQHAGLADRTAEEGVLPSSRMPVADQFPLASS